MHQHSHDHNTPHDAGGHAHHAHADQPAFSFLQLSAAQRLIGALAISAVLWAAILGAMA